MKLGHIPEMGDQVEVEGFQLRVEAVAGNTVTAVCIVLPEDKLRKAVKGAGEGT
jgi:Mg2+/Co2+ transporter CorC